MEHENICAGIQVGLKKYASVSPTAFGLVGKKRLAVIRAAGAIVGGSGGSPSVLQLTHCRCDSPP